MKREGEIVLTIREDGTVRLQILNNDSPGHGELLTPFEQSAWAAPFSARAPSESCAMPIWTPPPAIPQRPIRSIDVSPFP